MLELIPTLLAQQPLKQTATSVRPIERNSLTQSQSLPPTVTPEAAIAIPESIIIPVAATPSPTATPASQVSPVASKVALPKVPQVRTSRTTPRSTPQPTPQAAPQVFSQTEPAAPKLSSTTPAKLTEKAAPSTAPSAVETPTPTTESTKPRTRSIEIPVPKPRNQEKSPQEIEIPVPQPSNSVKPNAPRLGASDRIESPTSKPTAQNSPQSSTQAQKQLLEQRLADIVAKDRAVKQAAQRETLVARAYSYATQRRFEQARKLLQDPAISAEVRAQILSNINSLESASRTIGVAPIKVPPAKPNRLVTTRKSSTVSRSIPIRVPRPQQAVIVQVPTAIDSLPIQQKPPVIDRTTPIASDASSDYSGQVVDPKNLQAFNRNLPKLDSTKRIVYPLPEPVPVTSRFGWRRHPVTGVRRFHAGVDLGAGQGTPVIASRGGKVKIADRMGGYGLAIVLQQPNGTQDTLYAHLSQIFVRPGETIQPGAMIGRVGSTGLSTGPHLHYEARRKTNSGWVAYDPGGQLEAARVQLVQARRLESQSSLNRGG